MGAFDMGPFWKCRRGFTTIEVIAVLIIIGVLSAVVVARYWGTSSYSVSAVAEELKNHLRYAQGRAMNSTVTAASTPTPNIWGINFVDSTHYTVFRDGDTTHTVPPPGSDSDPVNLSSRGVTLGSLGTGIVSFDEWGKPYTDAVGTTPQSEQPPFRLITVLGGGQTGYICISKNTGYILNTLWEDCPSQ
jgi:prepilin-type N-terminal cleavage/methylation domain-containing protein